MVYLSQKSVKMAANGGSLKCKPPFAEFGDSPVIAELPLVTAIPTETGDVEVRRSTGVNRRDHHRAGISASFVLVGSFFASCVCIELLGSFLAPKKGY